VARAARAWSLSSSTQQDAGLTYSQAREAARRALERQALERQAQASGSGGLLPGPGATSSHYPVYTIGPEPAGPTSGGASGRPWDAGPPPPGASSAGASQRQRRTSTRVRAAAPAQRRCRHM
jgi:hypothetical protein